MRLFSLQEGQDQAQVEMKVREIRIDIRSQLVVEPCNMCNMGSTLHISEGRGQAFPES